MALEWEKVPVPLNPDTGQRFKHVAEAEGCTFTITNDGEKWACSVTDHALSGGTHPNWATGRTLAGLKRYVEAQVVGQPARREQLYSAPHWAQQYNW